MLNLEHPHFKLFSTSLLPITIQGLVSASPKTLNPQAVLDRQYHFFEVPIICSTTRAEEMQIADC